MVGKARFWQISSEIIKLYLYIVNRLCYNISMNGWFALLAFACGFLIAQLWKAVTSMFMRLRKGEAFNLQELFRDFMRSGGMPSGHSASMTALTVYLGIWQGFDSAIFALGLAFNGIVIYDAVHVRYAVGEQGKALNKVLVKNGQKPLKIVEGHTTGQALVGIILGIIIGVVVGVIFKA